MIFMYMTWGYFYRSFFLEVKIQRLLKKKKTDVTDLAKSNMPEIHQ